MRIDPALIPDFSASFRKVQPWRSVNGPELVRQATGRFPGWIPYTLVLHGTIGTVIGQTVTVTARTDGDADFWVLKTTAAISHVASPGSGEGARSLPVDSPFVWPIQAEVSEETGGVRLTNAPTAIGAMFGRAGHAYTLPAPWILRPDTTVRITLRTLCPGAPFYVPAGDQEFWLCLHGFKRTLDFPDVAIDVFLEPRLLSTLQDYRAAGELGRVEPFFYTFLVGQGEFTDSTVTGHSPLETETPTVTMADADFAGLHYMAELYDEDGIPIYKNGTVTPYDHLVRLVIDEGRTRLDDRACTLLSLAGHGKRFNKFPKALIVPAGHTLTALYVAPTIVPQSETNEPPRGYITLAGVRIFPTMRPGR